MIQNTYGEEIMELNFMNKDMKDKSATKLETKNEMLIYEAEGSNLVDVYHLIQSQIQTINAQSKTIKELERSAKLLARANELCDRLDFEQGNGQY